MWRRAEICRAARCAGDERPALPVPVLIARLGSCRARSRRRLFESAALALAARRSPWPGDPRSVTGCPPEQCPAVLRCGEAGLLPGKSVACLPPITGLLAAKNVWSALYRRVSRCSSNGAKVAWLITLVASTCLATFALPSILSLKSDQRAIRTFTFCRMAVKRAVTVSAGSLDREMPKCFMLAPCAAKVTPVAASGPARWLKLHRSRP